PEPDIAGYRLSNGTASRSYSTTLDVGQVTSYSFSVTGGLTYYFALQAYNTAGVLSSYSAELAVLVPLPSGPNISGVSPASGSPGASVTISGGNFGATKGASTISFNGVTATPTSWSATSIVVQVPAGATSGDVVATIAGVQSNGSFFTVTGSGGGGGGGGGGGLSPYNGTPVVLPGQVDAEEFDNGGEGVAYHDTTGGNSGGQVRNADVDIEAASEGGYDVGWTAPGEWLNYTVNVTSTGTYTVNLRVASSGGASIHVGFNASNVWKVISIPNTGGWQNWTTVSFSATLNAGTQQMTLLFDTGGINLRNVLVSSSGGGSGGGGSAGGGSAGGGLSPYNGTPVVLPGQVDAEAFDNGGEGVAYHDTTAGNSAGQVRNTGVDIEAA